jgi:hypothetical protein
VRAWHGITVTVVAAAFLLTPAALADGDPASDYLQSQDVYTPYSLPALPAASVLASSVKRSFVRGFRIKVAVIATPFDLGSITGLFGKPKLYARFLGTELGQFYVGPLLIAMPSGFGIYDGGRSTTAEARVLARLKPDASSANALVTSAAAAVKTLLAAGALHSKDVLAPFVYPRVPFTQAGQTVSLSYSVLEDSELSSELVTVLSGDTTLATFKIPPHRALFNQPQSVKWTVPDPAPANLRFCVLARDASGNHRPASCLPIKIS